LTSTERPTYIDGAKVAKSPVGSTVETLRAFEVCVGSDLKTLFLSRSRDGNEGGRLGVCGTSCKVGSCNETETLTTYASGIPEAEDTERLGIFKELISVGMEKSFGAREVMLNKEVLGANSEEPLLHSPYPLWQPSETKQ